MHRNDADRGQVLNRSRIRNRKWFFREFDVKSDPLKMEQKQMILIQQKREMAEYFGFETRNKYQVMDETDRPIAHVVEQNKGILGFVLRQILGHWRPFELHFFSLDRELIMVAHHPFRWFFRRLEVYWPNGEPIGALQMRFQLFSTRYDVENSQGAPVMQVRAPFWRIWTFPYFRRGKQVAVVAKKWGGLLTEVFTDSDRFIVDYQEADLSTEEKYLIFASALFVDLIYFESKAG